MTLQAERVRPLDLAQPASNGNGHKVVPTIGGRPVDPERISAAVEEMGAEEALAWALETFGGGLAYAISFQKTSSVIIDMAHRLDPASHFLYIDTELLFPETYATRDRLPEPFLVGGEPCVHDHPPAP